MLQTNVFVVVFNSKLSSGCDYAFQTMRILSRRDTVFGLALGDILSIKQLFFDNDRWLIRDIAGVTIIRPLSILPGVRYRRVRLLSYIYTSILLNLYLTLFYRRSPKLLWFFEPFHIPEILSLFRHYVTVYDCVDYYPGFSAYAKFSHRTLLQKAQFIFVNSLVLEKELKTLRPDTVSVPLGFASDLFILKQHKSIKKSRFIVGYVGSISDRIDFKILLLVIKMMPKIIFEFVGPLEHNVFDGKGNVIKEFYKIRKSTNVKWMGQVTKQEVPKIIRGMDICIIPYRTDYTFNKYSFPMKALEYFAMEKPVIATPIIELKKYEDRKLLILVNSAQEFISAIKKIRREGWDRTLQLEQRKEAQKNSWEKKISSIYSVIFAKK